MQHHARRYNFLHRQWGPLEPFDDSLPELLRERSKPQGGRVHCHLCTDHSHYWEDGGATYHQRFSTFEFVRGQEGDKWIGVADGVGVTTAGDAAASSPSTANRTRSEEATTSTADATTKKHAARHYPETFESSPMMQQDQLNRDPAARLTEMPQYKTFSQGLEFIERNADSKTSWMLQIESFDPHEPFFSPEEFRALYPHDWNGPEFDWPPYRRVIESEAAVLHIRRL
jgi:hypothetical protein